MKTPLTLKTQMALASAALGLILLSACKMTPAELAALEGATGTTGMTGATGSHDGDGHDHDGDSQGSAAACFEDTFVQPSSPITSSIDILFVVDTSDYMEDRRSKLAGTLSALVGELPPAADYQVAVMLAVGSTSSWSGKLFSYGGYQVLSSKTMSFSAIQGGLNTLLTHIPYNRDGERGGEGSYSLSRGITTNLALNQSEGFFRGNAALGVVFVSHGHDVCAPYAGQSYLWDLDDDDDTIRHRDCPGGIATNTVISEVKALQGNRPYLFAAITHIDNGYHGDCHGGGDSDDRDGYGYGYVDLVTRTNGVSFDIGDDDYSQGLSSLGKQCSTKLNQVVDFSLSHKDIDATTLRCKIDGHGVGAEYDPVADDIHLSCGGNPLSIVSISYCTTGEGTGGPSPTPSPSVTPTPTPSPSALPSASPSASPSVTPTPSPSTSPSSSPTPTGSPIPSDNPSPVPTPTYIPPAS